MRGRLRSTTAAVDLAPRAAPAAKPRRKKSFAPEAVRAAKDGLQRDLWESLRPYTWHTPSLRWTAELTLASILVTARELDDGDRFLSPLELERARRLLTTLVPQGEVAEAHRRLDLLATRGARRERLPAGVEPLEVIHLPCTGGAPRLKILVTGGVHGDERCGMGAAVLLAEQLAADERLRREVEITVVPAVMPRTMRAGTRRTADDVDPNRTFAALDGAPAEVRAVAGLIDRGYDLVLDLHGANPVRNGFFALHNGAAELLSPAVGAFAARWPVLRGEVRSYRLSEPGLAESDNQGTLKGYAQRHGARWAVTLEAPASLGYAEQVVGEYALAREIIAAAMAQTAGVA